MRSNRFHFAGLLAAIVALQPLSADAGALILQPVGPGAVTGLSADANSAVGLTSDTLEPFRWTVHGGFTALGRGTWIPLGHGSGIPAISANGRVVTATILDDGGTYSTAGRWTPATGWQMLLPLPPDGGLLDGEDSSVFGISRDGKVVTGLYWRPGAQGGSAHGMAWTAATGMLDMGSSGGSSRIDDANADGSVLVGWDEAPDGHRRATLWAGGTMTILDNTDWPSEASAVNPSGTIIVGQAADPANGFAESAVMWRWNGGGWTTTVLGVMSKGRQAGTAYPESLSDDGSVVVGTARLDASKPQSVGFIWTAATGMLQAPDYLKANGVAVNPLYKIVDLSAVSADGSVIAAVEQAVQVPYASRSVLIRPNPKAAP